MENALITSLAKAQAPETAALLAVAAAASWFVLPKDKPAMKYVAIGLSALAALNLAVSLTKKGPY